LIAQANGTEAKTEIVQGYPVLVNSAELVAEVRPLLEQVVGKGRGWWNPGLSQGLRTLLSTRKKPREFSSFLG
jgi:amidohydrolase